MKAVARAMALLLLVGLAGALASAQDRAVKVHKPLHRPAAELVPIAQLALGEEGTATADAGTNSLVLIGGAGRASEAQDQMARLLVALGLVRQLGRSDEAIAGEEVTTPSAPPSGKLPAAEPEPDRTRMRLEAERAFREGQAHLAADRIEEAARAFARAVELEPLEPEYHMYEAWSAYQAARVQVRVQRARLTACARKVAEEDESCAVAHTILGRLALDEANPGLARREFEAALLRDPEDTDAQAGLEKLER
ncbi:MAG: hypothetical protein CL910_01235 [Deltaproteobacteria bacterium]|jgi:tetratricopeptide (TPR) repeat protein|nr:hypothetical protein [Deltaproteobacteria bacterium]